MIGALGIILPILVLVALVAAATLATDPLIDWIARKLDAKPVKW